jgi:hypothetical protein
MARFKATILQTGDLSKTESSDLEDSAIKNTVKMDSVVEFSSVVIQLRVLPAYAHTYTYTFRGFGTTL